MTFLFPSRAKKAYLPTESCATFYLSIYLFCTKRSTDMTLVRPRKTIDATKYKKEKCVRETDKCED